MNADVPSDNAPPSGTPPVLLSPPESDGQQEENKGDGGEHGGAANDSEEKPDEPMPEEKGVPDRILSYDASLAFANNPSFPAHSTGSPSAEPATPTHFEVPPSHSLGGAPFFVGIPAWSTHAHQSKFACDGYAGMEVLMEVEGLSAVDLSDLNELVGLGEDVTDFFLRPRGSRSPDAYELESMLGSMLVKREMASILMQYEPRGLAERVFSMTTFVRRLLVKYRDMRGQVESLGSGAVEEALKLRAEIDRVKRDYSMLKAFYDGQLENLMKDLHVKQSRRQNDLRKVMREHDAEVTTLRKEVIDLRARLDDSMATQRDLASKLRIGAFSVPRLMNFLNQRNTKVGGNCQRLRELLAHFKAGSPVPTEWRTLINVTSADDVFADPGPYTVEREDDSDEEKEDDASSPHGNNPHVDLTQDDPPSGGSSQRSTSSSRPKRTPRKSTRQVPVKTQWRPTGWKESDEDARPPDQALVMTEQAACASLGGLPVVWRKLRMDVQLAIQAGMGYKGAIKLLSSDSVAHTLFHPESLGDMLALMMYWNRLDETPWSRFVPEVYFLRAENLLEDSWNADQQPDYWPELRDVTVDEAQEILDDFGSDKDDEAKDETWDPSEETVERTLQFESPHKRKRGSVSADSDAPPSSTASTAKKARPENLRKQSKLARKPYASLTPSELAIIETPGPGITSWRHLGVLTTFAPATVHAVDQSLGFPDYVPNRNQGMAQLRARWNESAHAALMATVPWRKMFRSRVQNLLLHRRSELSDEAKAGLDSYVGFMQKNARAFWMAGHWTTFDVESSDYAEDEVKDRKRLHDSASKGVATQMERLKATGVPSTIFHEPGVWTYPTKTCAWILMDESTKTATGEPHTLAEQLKVLDKREPARAQWTSCSSDEERIAHLPADIRAMLLPASERQDNPVSLKFQ